jgi:two-component system chemotaxis sensor kinase CheA
MDTHDPMIEVFIFENEQLLENLENVLLQGEKVHYLDDEQINEVFRIMHTIKGSSSMMSFDGLAKLSHAVEDMFSQIREKKARSNDWDEIFDIVLNAVDLIKADIAKIQSGAEPDGQADQLIEKIHSYIKNINGRTNLPEDEDGVKEQAEDETDDFGDFADIPFYKAKVTFEPECQMENMRAFGLANDLKKYCLRCAHIPEDLMAEDASGFIVKNGFVLYLQSAENPDSLKKVIDETLFLKSGSLINIDAENEEIPLKIRPKKTVPDESSPAQSAAPKEIRQIAAENISKQNFISVNVNKLDKLMDLVGEIVTTESMVTKNPEIVNLNIESFERSAQQLHKLINEMQDIVMSTRMVPISTTFHKMQRIVRDMSKKVDKDVNLAIIGEETEVDKNIIDNLSDPLMHLIRNAVDHGIEPAHERIAKGKPPSGNLTLEARNSGGDVMIMVTDDGRGLNRTSLIEKAIEKGLTAKTDAEISDKEAYNLIFLPGFSTKENVTEFSGRGVGMDVVRRNIEKVSGNISVESGLNEGTSIQIKIPLTLAIIEGMKLQVGDLIFIVPMLTIQESFKPNMKDVFLDPDGNEMIMIRGECYPIIRLHKIFAITPRFENLADGILIMINTDNDTYCIFVDQLIGEQQAVVKPLPAYIQRHNNKMHGIGGCAILGDGSISLIIDINNLVPGEA